MLKSLSVIATYFLNAVLVLPYRAENRLYDERVRGGCRSQLLGGRANEAHESQATDEKEAPWRKTASRQSGIEKLPQTSSSSAKKANRVKQPESDDRPACCPSFGPHATRGSLGFCSSSPGENETEDSSSTCGKIPLQIWPGQALESTQRGLNLPCP